MGRAIANAIDLGAMAGIAALVWFGWNPVMRYLPGRLAGDLDVALGWIGIEAETRGWLGWLSDVEWLVGAVLLVVVLWIAEKFVGLARRYLVGEPA